MTFFGKKYAVCVTVPKCGSTSTKNYLVAKGIGYVYNGTLSEDRIMIASPLMYIDDDHPGILNDAFVFAVVRNPYDRALSASRFLGCSLSSPPKWPDGLTWPYDNGTDEQRKAVSMYNHLTLTAKRLMTLGDGTTTRCDRFVRLENFRKELFELLDKMGFQTSGDLPWDRRSGTNKQPSLDDQINIEKLYAEDFEFLGYELLMHQRSL